ncbi:MAG: hypothetical protein ACE5I1_01525 [bacterium]
MFKKVCPNHWAEMCMLMLFGMSTSAFSQEFIRAKIGLKVISEDIIKNAKSKDKLKKGDKLRLFIEPEVNTYVYVVHADRKSVSLLTNSPVQLTKANERVVLPSPSEYYEIDGTSAIEKLAILCSPARLNNVEAFFSVEKPSPAEWEKMELAFIEKSKIDLNEKTEKPYAIAGNVRNVEQQNEQFLSALNTYSGKSLVLKRYEFRVKK